METSLVKIFGDNTLSDLMKEVFNDFDIDKAVSNVKEKITSFIPDYGWLKPNYDLVDRGDDYCITVDYDETRDKVYVKTDNNKHLLSVGVYDDFDKSDSFTSCTYYGKYTMTVPEDCDLESMVKSVDKENKKMEISFKKIKKNEEETTDKTVFDSEETYKEKYEKLLNKYAKKITELDNKYNNAVSELEEKTNSLRKENEELKKKLNNIKKLFN